MSRKDADQNWENLAESDHARRSDKHQKNQNTSKAAKKKPWYLRPIFFAGLGALLVLAAAGAVLAVRMHNSSGTAAASMTTTDGSAPAASTQAPSTIHDVVAAMPLEDKVGQMIMAGFDGKTADAAAPLIKDRHVGGFVLFGTNIDSHQQVAQLDASLQQLASGAGEPAQLLIATDQEGGKTRRFMDIGPNYSEPFIGEMRGGAGVDTAKEISSLAARQLRQIGINTDLAPVGDVSAGWGTLMDGRSYGSDAKVTAEETGAAVTGFNNATTISCVKHFPGLGSAHGDPEDGPSKVSLDKDTLESSDLLPFKEAIKDDAPMIMVTHVSVSALDPSKTPASLSRPIITDLLRGELGFKGVVITDDLEMGAISQSPGDAAVAAIGAGADIVMFAHTPSKAAAAYDAIIAAVKSGKLSEDDINASVERILQMKQRFRLEKSGATWSDSGSAAGAGDGGTATGSTTSSTTSSTANQG